MAKRDDGFDLKAAEATFEVLMTQVGLDPGSDAQMAGTARRVTALWAELFAGVREPVPQISLFEGGDQGSGRDEPVVVRGLPFFSMCAHHFLPFFGTFDVVYVPGEQIGGVGSFSRVIRHFAMQPQVQERLVQQVADSIGAQLGPKGVLVRSTARHLCMEMRGEKVQGELVSTASLGVLKEGPRRAEALGLIA